MEPIIPMRHFDECLLIATVQIFDVDLLFFLPSLILFSGKIGVGAGLNDSSSKKRALNSLLNQQPTKPLLRLVSFHAKSYLYSQQKQPKKPAKRSGGAISAREFIMSHVDSAAHERNLFKVPSLQYQQHTNVLLGNYRCTWWS